MIAVPINNNRSNGITLFMLMSDGCTTQILEFVLQKQMESFVKIFLFFPFAKYLNILFFLSCTRLSR